MGNQEMVKEQFRALAQARQADVQTEGSALWFSTNESGVPMTLRCEARNEGCRLRFRAETGPLPELAVSSETGFERFGKRLGLSREVQTGDEAFDRQAYIDTALPEAAVHEIAGRAGFRRGVLSLLESGFAVELGAEGLSATRDSEILQDLDPDRVRPALQAAALAVAELKNLDPRWLAHRSPRWPMVVSVTALLAAATGLYAFTTAATGTRIPLGSELQNLGLLWGLGACVVAVPVLVLLLRGRSDAFQHLIASGLGLLFALPLWAGTGAVIVNAGFDDSPPVVRKTSVVTKEEQKARGVIRRVHAYYIRVQSWSAQPVPRLEITKSLYTPLQRGAPVEVVTRRGFLGREWVEEVRAGAPNAGAR
jgi:hypothetical protein